VFDNIDYDDLLRWVPAWMALEQAKLMLGHLSTATGWPENAIYCHSCITALRSFTFLLQKEFAHDPGFAEWYDGVRARLTADPEFQYRKHARNYVLKEGALMIRTAPGTTRCGRARCSSKGLPSCPTSPARSSW
jgi:hypothetical protein